MTTPDDLAGTPRSDDSAVPSAVGRRIRIGMLVVAALVAGFVARSLVAEGADSFLVRWLPWMQQTPATMYFTDAAGTTLVPVSRTLSRNATVEDFVAEYIGGPAEGTGLIGVVPGETTVDTLAFEAGTLRVGLSGDPAAFASPLIREAIRQSLTSWEGVDAAVLSVSGTPVDIMGSTGHLLFFYDEQRDMLVAQPASATEPRDVLTAYLEGPEAPNLVGLPRDVQLLEFEFIQDSGLLTLDFTYVQSVRTFALDHPEAMRRVLEGLIATMTTGFPQIEGLYLDFEGRATLGLGQCADLLRTLQLQPEILNDERLLARRAA